MHPMPNLKKVSLEQDRAYQTRFLGRVDAALKQSLPQTLYVNHLVGASKDLIFGVSLVDYATERGLTGGPGIALGLAGIAKVQGSEAQGTVVPPNDKDKSRPAPLTSWEDAVPKLVRKCVTEVERRGLYQEGIYRVSGRLAVVQELRHVVEKDETAFEFNPQTDDVFCVASLLKAYLRELPEPVFRFPLQERIQHTEDRDDQIQMKFPVLRNKMRRLPFVHQATLRMIIEHLSHIAGRAHQNKMDARNLAIVFGTPLFGEDEMPKGDNVLSISSWKDSVLEDMINYAGLLFDEKGPSTPPASSISVPTNLNVTPPPVPPGKEYDAYPENREASPPSALNADPNADSRPQRNAGSSSPAPSSPGNPAISNVKGDDRARSPTPPPLPPRARGVETLSPTSPTDFAPRLPARPNYSIHPGAKRGPNDVNEEDISSPGGGAISPVPVFDSQGNKITVITPPPGWKEGTENGASNLLSPTDSVGRGRDVNANAGNNRSTGARSPTPTAL
ncbi:hypothetical protein FRC02_006241 [Tulasnella sp. 418]|nr:hypothetical protein FRC02_006241 [Tulasnella sp. 418]